MIGLCSSVVQMKPRESTDDGRHFTRPHVDEAAKFLSTGLDVDTGRSLI